MSAALPRRSLRARAPELARVCRRVLVVLLFGILPASLLLVILVGSFRSGTGAWAIDFDGNFLRPAHEILRGVSPYHPGELEHVRRAVAAGHRPDEFHDGVFPAYPAPALLLGVPFSLPPARPCGVDLGGLHAARRRPRAAPRRRARLARLRSGPADAGRDELRAARRRRLRAHARDRGLLALARSRRARRPRARRDRRAQARGRAARRLAARDAALARRRDGGRRRRGAVARGLGSDRIPRPLGLSAPALAADRHRERSRLLGRGLRESDRHLRPGRLARAVRRRRRPAGGALAREQATRRGRTRRRSSWACSSCFAFSPIVWHHYLVLLFVPLAIYCPRFAPIWLLPTRLLGRLARCVPLHRPGGAAGVPGRDRGHLRLDADAHARCRRPGVAPAAPRGTLPAWR